MLKYFFVFALITASFEGSSQQKSVPEGFELVSLDGKDALLNLETGKIKLINLNDKKVASVVNEVLNTNSTTSSFDKIHTVKKGETLYEIARTYDVTVRDISANNRFDREIYPGQDIIISKDTKVSSTIANTTNKEFHIIEKGETLYRLSKNYNISISRLKELNQLSDNTIIVGQKIKLN